jgi:hypothetical protein
MNKGKQMKKKQTYAIGSLILVGLVLSFQNCSPEKSFSGSQSLSSVNTTGFVDTCTGSNCTMNPAVDTKIVGVTHSENLLLTMQNETGVSNVTVATIKNMVAAQIGKVPDKGTADSVTAPMWLAVTTVAGEVCQQLIVQEKAGPLRIFKGVGFGTALTSPTVKDGVIRQMARSFWSRNESQDEHDMIRADLDRAFPAGTVSSAQTDNSMLYLCTVMLSSLDAQKQ